jgi:hypothetical protein
LKKLIAKKDLSALVWCMPQFFFRLSRFIARPGITVIKNKRIANDKQGKNSAKTRLEKSETRRKYYLDLWQKMKAENAKNSPTKINAEYFKWLDDNNIEYKSKATEAKHANRWRKSAGLK